MKIHSEKSFLKCKFYIPKYNFKKYSEKHFLKYKIYSKIDF